MGGCAGFGKQPTVGGPLSPLAAVPTEAAIEAMPHQLGHGPQPGAETLPRDRVDCSAFNTDLAEFSRLLPAPDRRGIRCVQRLGSSLC